MRPGIRLTPQERQLRIDRYKIKRNKRRWGLMEYKDLGRRDYVNRRLRVKGRFISKETAYKLLFGPNARQEAAKYDFEQLKAMINEKFNSNASNEVNLD